MGIVIDDVKPAVVGATWCGSKQPGRRYGPAPAGNGQRADVAPLDQRAREDRYRRQTGRLNLCEAETEPVLDFFPAAGRARLLGLTPKQRRRSEKKAWHGDLVLRGLGKL